MLSYTWDEYYGKYYDWSESTRVRNLNYLTNIGAADDGIMVTGISMDVSLEEIRVTEVYKYAP